jgi:hypothetical protein
VLRIIGRAGNYLNGETDLDFLDGHIGRLGFGGITLDGRYVSWITHEIGGLVTTPGLYVGMVNEGHISGSWSVPEYEHEGGFELELQG